MSQQMEYINTEEIMQEIRTQIAERGYSRTELRFADVTAGMSDSLGEIPDFFELQNFGLTVDQMDARREVQCWRLISGNRIIVFVKKIIRKLVKFYVEPIIKSQNEFNFYTTSAIAQLRAKCEEEQDIKLLEMQKRIEELEKRCRELEEKCGE